MRELMIRAAIVCLAGLATAAQARLPTFDVASVKANRSGDVPMRISVPRGGSRFDATNVTARLLILNAYQFRDFQLADVPSWVRSERFDVSARAPGPATREEISAMVRALLADRFRLRAHQETREMPVYALVVAAPDRRLGPAMRPSATDCATSVDRSACSTTQTPTSLGAGGMTMVRLAQTLSAVVGRMVTDDTGLTGGFDLQLTFAPEQAPGPGPPPAADADAPSLFTALREQLGLRLDGKRGPVELLVIDSIERPTPD